MRPLLSLLSFLVLFLHALPSALAASAWGFSEATVSVAARGSGVSGGFKEKLTEHKVLQKPVTLAAGDSLKIILTTQETRTAKRPHQAFLLLKDASSSLDISYPFNVKDNGKAKVELTQKDIPTQLLRSSVQLEARLLIASFGSSSGYDDKAFTLSVEYDSDAPVDLGSKPLRYGKSQLIDHVFRADPKSPNMILSLIFMSGVLATLPVLVGVWLYLGGNLNHLSKALQDAPFAHVLFLGSIISIEGVFFMYYTTWNLFTTLPVLSVIGTVSFLSGSRALTEVQERRLAGLR